MLSTVLLCYATYNFLVSPFALAVLELLAQTHPVVVHLGYLLRELLIDHGRLVQLLSQRQVDVIQVQVLLLFLFDSNDQRLQIVFEFVGTLALLIQVLLILQHRRNCWQALKKTSNKKMNK